MLDTETSKNTGTEIIYLEQLFNSDCKCEANHAAIERVCSKEVVAILTTSCANRSRKICQSSVNYIDYWLKVPRAICFDCGAPIASHWGYRLI